MMDVGKLTGALLAFNAGSSSIKFALFRFAPDASLACACRGSVELVGVEQHFKASDASGAMLVDERWIPKDRHFQPVLERVLNWIETWLGDVPLVAVGHRVVHGGSRYFDPEFVTPQLLAALNELIPLAPLHQPHDLSPIHIIATIRKDLPQVVCFDTGFHRTMPMVATRYGLPRELYDQGIRRYGFHGLSYAFIAQRLREIAPEVAQSRVVAAHLGNGASLCAMTNGVSIDTTMGFSVLDGLLMGTRCGSLDPGVILYLLRQGERMEAIEDMLYRRSGLLGVSGGLAADMRSLLASDDLRAKEAVELFVYRIVREIGALVSSLGGLDALVFTGGIGEHASEIRERVCAGLLWLGVEVASVANDENERLISKPTSHVPVWVIPTDEEWMIASYSHKKLSS
jgi:acetate kinase